MKGPLDPGWWLEPGPKVKSARDLANLGQIFHNRCIRRRRASGLPNDVGDADVLPRRPARSPRRGDPAPSPRPFTQASPPSQRRHEAAATSPPHLPELPRRPQRFVLFPSLPALLSRSAPRWIDGDGTLDRRRWNHGGRRRWSLVDKLRN